MLERLAEHTRQRELDRGREEARQREARGAPRLRPRRVSHPEAQERVREAHRVLKGFRVRDAQRRVDVRRAEEAQQLLWAEQRRGRDAAALTGRVTPPTRDATCAEREVQRTEAPEEPGKVPTAATRDDVLTPHVLKRDLADHHPPGAKRARTEEVPPRTPLEEIVPAAPVHTQHATAFVRDVYTQHARADVPPETKPEELVPAALVHAMQHATAFIRDVYAHFVNPRERAPGVDGLWSFL